ncbi:thermonuclease family protein [Roseibium sp.]|uniref:thermonuclease family protein n=1 Tax=Roseibium sp. TaxID=1936156 RepID=UPI003A974054
MQRRFTPFRRSLCAVATLIAVQMLLPAALAAGTKAVRVIDGDTIELGGEKIRLDGIDAPELGQTCLTSTGKPWPCGKASRDYLKRLTQSGPVTCRGTETDAYDRRIATCHADTRNLNAEMIRSGHALAFRRYSTAYVVEEEAARIAGKGLWAGLFDMPWDYRAQKWQVAAQAVPADCPIKGNITSRGKIYHTPWSPHYDRTRIDESAGERWFCSEAEALAAGWRAAR